MGLISILLCKVRHTSVLFRWVLELVRSLFYHAAWCFCSHRAQRSLNYSRVTAELHAARPLFPSALRTRSSATLGSCRGTTLPRRGPRCFAGSCFLPVTCSSRCFLQFPAPVLSVPPTVTSKRPCTRQFFTDYLHVADSPLSALLLLQLPLASARRACAFYSLRLYLQFYLFISFDWIAGNLLKSILMLNNSLFMYVCYLTHSLIF